MLPSVVAHAILHVAIRPPQPLSIPSPTAQVSMDPIPSTAARTSRRPPMGVLILVCIRVLDAAILLAAAAGVRDVAGEAVWGRVEPIAAYLDPLYVLAAVLSVLVAIGLLVGHRWGWTGATILTGFGLFTAIWAYVGGAGNDLRLILLVLSALYLNQSAVRERYLGPRR